MSIKRSAWTLVVVSSFLSAGTLFAQEPASQTGSGQADNTRVNVRDRNANEPTADNQKNNMSDRDITKQIRQSLAKDDSLSTYAHNVKVVTQNGQVTLKGPVRSEDEKRAVESKATAIAGENKVTSELDVKQKR
jgi:hyperosmotically inducible periplasmic protein